MAVNSTVRTAGPYLGTGLVATYPFSFKVFQASDVLVVETVGNTQTTMTLTTDYTVALNADQNNNPGGSITLTAGNLPSTTTLTMTSQVPQTQGQTIANFSGFLPSVLTDAYDKLTILVQQLAQLLGRGITFPISDGTNLNAQLPVASARANQFISFDALGNVNVSSGLASVSVSSAMTPVVGASTLGYAEQLLAQGNIASAAAGFADTNVLEQSTFGANSYVQDITQNTSSGVSASADIVVANNLATSTTFYGNFGMNSSGFTGSGSFNKASAVYLTATSGDLVIGTTTANAIHFVYSGGTTDAASIDSTGFNVPTPSIGTNAANKAYVDATIANPTATVIMLASSTVPSGYLECDGSAVSRTTYSALFAAVATTYGVGNGTTTFNLPDMRGYFPRGWAHGGSVDSGRTLGSTQADQVGQINVLARGNSDIGFLASVGGSLNSLYDVGASGNKNFNLNVGNETRVKNIAFMFCIKT